MLSTLKAEEEPRSPYLGWEGLMLPGILRIVYYTKIVVLLKVLLLSGKKRLSSRRTVNKSCRTKVGQ